MQGGYIPAVNNHIQEAWKHGLGRKTTVIHLVYMYVDNLPEDTSQDWLRRMFKKQRRWEMHSYIPAKTSRAVELLDSSLALFVTIACPALKCLSSLLSALSLLPSFFLSLPQPCCCLFIVVSISILFSLLASSPIWLADRPPVTTLGCNRLS